MATVTLTIIEGKSLIACNKNGFSDPYLVINVAGKKQKSKHVENTLSPMWNESFTFKNLDPEKLEVVIRIQHKQMVGKDQFMGEVILDAKELVQLSQTNQAQWLPVQPSKTKQTKVSGELRLRVTYIAEQLDMQHQFVPHSFPSPVSCQACQELIVGASGVKCSRCGHSIHAKCTSAPRKSSCGHRNIKDDIDFLLVKASQAAKEAIDVDQSGNAEEAIKLYEKAVSLLAASVKLESDKKQQQQIAHQINTYLERVEALTQQLRKDEDDEIEEKPIKDKKSKKSKKEKKSKHDKQDTPPTPKLQRADTPEKQQSTHRYEKQEIPLTPERQSRSKQERPQTPEKKPQHKHEQADKPLQPETPKTNTPPSVLKHKEDKTSSEQLKTKEATAQVKEEKAVRKSSKSEDTSMPKPTKALPVPPAPNKQVMKRSHTQRKFLVKQMSVAASKWELREKEAPMDSTIKSIIAKCIHSKEKFTDSSFPPNTASLYPNGVPSNVNRPVAKWIRISDLAKDAALFVNGVEPGDVIQGSLGDCWFLGPLSVVASHTDLLMKLFVTTTINPYGVYAVRFFKNNAWVTVVVDDWIPCDEKGRPVYAHCLDPSEMWVPLIEKAYAKLHSGYSAIVSGSEAAAFLDLTGCPPEERKLHSDINHKDVFPWIFKNVQSGHLLGCALITPGKVEEEKNGLLTNHAYGILDAREVEGHKLIKLRNPWGRGEWTGDWSDKSPLWTDSMKKAVDLVDANDGCFWMNDKDFVKYFNSYYSCTLLPDNIKKVTAQGAWKGTTAGGCSNTYKWKYNPQFRLAVKQKSSVNILMTQTEVRHKEKKQYPHIGFYLIKATSPMKSLELPDDVLYGHKFVDSRDVATEQTLEEGEYDIVPCTFKPDIEGPFWITVYSSTDVSLKQSKEWHIIEIQGKWSVSDGTAAGCANFTGWQSNPQYKVTVKKACRVVMTLDHKVQSEDDEYIGFYVVKESGKLTSLKNRVAVTAFTPSQITCDVKLDEGEYVVLPATFQKGVEGEFVLAFFAEMPSITVERIP